MSEIIKIGKAPEIRFSTFEILDGNTKELLIKAIEARNMGNQPVSQFHVGAAIEVKNHPINKIYTWSNYENVNFNGTTHAEQDAINRALSDRKDKSNYDNIKLNKLAVVGWLQDIQFDIKKFTIKTQEDILQEIKNKDLEEIMKEFITPCWHCRQIYATFLQEKTELILLNNKGMVAKIKNLETLMPFAFSKI